MVMGRLRGRVGRSGCRSLIEMGGRWFESEVGFGSLGLGGIEVSGWMSVSRMRGVVVGNWGSYDGQDRVGRIKEKKGSDKRE